MAAANQSIVDTMNKDLLKRTRALVEALEDDQDLDKDKIAGEVVDATFGGEGGDPGGDFGGAGGEGGALPPPPAGEMGDELGGDMGELPPEPGMGDEMGGGPEDEALGLLRDIATGIGRLADELAPAPEGGEGFGEFPGEEGGEGDEGGAGGPPPPKAPKKGEGEDEEDDDDKNEPGVPPVDDDDEFGETMPVASGA